MDVVCGRCRAEYEFDDALISERGTTVRCTNCGLQFKVFPPVGLRAPEVWQVFDPKDRRVEPTSYESLRELQKAIARGDVRADHLLSRGEESPRPLSEIVELQPLLQQPRSEPPPPSGNVPDVKVPAASSTGAASRVGSSTVMGIQTRPDPAARAVDAPAPPAPPTVETDDEAAIVPSSPPEAIDVSARSEGTESRPKIRSALSMNPAGGAPSSSSAPAPAASGSIAPPRQSLRSTLSGSFPPPSQGAPLAPKPAAAAPRQDSRQQASEEPTSQPPTSQPPTSQPPTSQPPALESQRPSPPPVEPTPERDVAPPSITAPIDPQITDSGEYPGQLTPTPSGMRAYRSPDAQPVSSVAGVPVKRRAHSSGIVFAVLLGGAAFLGFANRDKIANYLAGPAPEKEAAPVEQELSTELVLRLERAEIAWTSDKLLQTPESQFDGGPRAADLQKLAADLTAAGAASSWHMVNVRRSQGKFDEARALAGELTKGAEQSYSLALLDLAEAGDAPPWPVVLERLKEASTGERGRYVARSAYIYALAASGDLPRARADYEAFAQLAGAEEAPLFHELKSYLDRNSEEGAADPEEGTPTMEEAPDEAAPSPQPQEGTSAPPAPEPADKEPAPSPKVADEEKPAPAPQTKDVSNEIKQKVAQADAMWRGGNQNGALAIYRQVVAQIGTSHFLGQRSAARIRQAEREKAAAQ